MNRTTVARTKITFSNALSVIAILLALIVLGVQFFKADKVVYVNTGIVLEKYQGMIDAKNKFEGLSKQWKDNLDTLTKEFQNDLKKYEKEQASMSAKEKQLSQELLRNKQQQLGQYQEAIQQKARDEEGKLSEGELKKINSYLEKYGKERHYNIIFGTSGGNILYADKGIEITDVIVDGLNKEYKGGK